MTLNNSATAAVGATITGGGSISCGSVSVGNNTAPTGGSTTATHTLTSSISSFSIANNLSIISTRTGGGTTRYRNGVFTVPSGTVTVAGVISPTTYSSSSSNATVSLGISSPTLVLTNSTPFGTTGNNGVFTTTLNGTGATVNYSGADQTVRGTAYTNLTLSGSGTKTIAGVTVTGILSMEGTAAASAAPTYGGSSALQYNKPASFTTGPEWVTPFTGTGGIVITNSGEITLNGAKVLNNASPIAINTGAKLNTDAVSNYGLTLGGNFTNNGTFTANTASVTFNGTTAQTIGGSTNTSFNNLVIKQPGRCSIGKQRNSYGYAYSVMPVF